MKGTEQTASSTDSAAQASQKRAWWAPPRWVLWCLIAFFLVLNLLAMLMAFPTSVAPPAKLDEPVTVFLVDHGVTSSLALPTQDGQMIRYMFADWNYYTLNNRGLLDTLAALLWPTTGALGRQSFDGPQEAETIRRHAAVEIEQIYELQVERQAVERLLARLEALVKAEQETLVADPAHRMEFVHHPHSYTYFHNSNHVVARWLRELGCEVRGPAYNSRWRLAAP